MSWQNKLITEEVAYRGAPADRVALRRDAEYRLYRSEGLSTALGAAQWVALLGLSVSLVALSLGTELFDAKAVIAALVVAVASAVGLVVSTRLAGDGVARARLLVKAYDKVDAETP